MGDENAPFYCCIVDELRIAFDKTRKTAPAKDEISSFIKNLCERGLVKLLSLYVWKESKMHRRSLFYQYKEGSTYRGEGEITGLAQVIIKRLSKQCTTHGGKISM